MQHLDSKIIQRSQGSYEEICTIKLRRFRYEEWFKFLTRKKKYNYKKNKGKKKVIIKNKINISERPEEANQRLEFGHFEADTIFSCSGSKSALLVLVDRFTRKTHIKKLERKTAFRTIAQNQYKLACVSGSVDEITSSFPQEGANIRTLEMGINKGFELNSNPKSTKNSPNRPRFELK